MSSKILKEYCSKIIEQLNEGPRVRKRQGGLSSLQSKKRDKKSIDGLGSSIQSQAFSKGDLREVYHQPIILSILDDVNETDLDYFLTVKDFIAFAEPGFQDRYVKKVFKDTNDAFGLFTYKMSKRDYEEIEIGRKAEPVIIPVNYVLASDIIDASSNLSDKSFKRRYGSEQGYIFTSTLTRENIQNALSKYGLSSVGIDIVNIENTEEIEKRFVKKFNEIGWKNYLKKMGYTPTKTRDEIKSIKKVYGMDQTSAETSSDEATFAASLTNTKKEFDEMLTIGIENNSKGYPNIFVLADLMQQGSDDVPWTYNTWFKSWKNANGNNALLFQKSLFFVNDPENPNSQEVAKIKKLFAEGYLNWLSSQKNYVDKKESEPKLDVSTKNNAYDLVKKASQVFAKFIREDRDIEFDSQGNLVNLSAQEEALYYRSIVEDYKFKLFTMPYIKSQENYRDYLSYKDSGLAGTDLKSAQSSERFVSRKHNEKVRQEKRKKAGIGKDKFIY